MLSVIQGDDPIRDRNAVVSAQAQNADGGNLIAGGYGGNGVRHGKPPWLNCKLWAAVNHAQDDADLDFLGSAIEAETELFVKADGVLVSLENPYGNGIVC